MSQLQPYTRDLYAVAFSRGDEKALAWFFSEYYVSLCLVATYYIADVEDAKEIVSEAFCKTWHYRTQFEKVASVRAYLYTVVRNDAIRYSKERRFRNASIQNMPADGTVGENIFDLIVKAETARYLHKAIATLPRQCRKIFELLYIKGKTVPEVAKELNLAPSTVRAHKLRGLNALRRLVVSGITLLLSSILR